tara:strand:+ start:621 stop:2051 length:1431 start_codon:yes stop_codon:yes gene_type:complete
MLEYVNIFVALGQNLALFIALMFLYGLILRRSGNFEQKYKMIIGSCLYGFIAIIGMTIPVHLFPGVQVDARDSIVLLASPFLGGWASIITAIFVGIYRLMIGGNAAIPASLVVLVTAAIGTLYAYKWSPGPSRIGTKHLLVLGMSIVGINCAAALFVPDITLERFLFFIIPYAIFSIAATVLLGLLLSHQHQQLSAEADLKRHYDKLASNIEERTNQLRQEINEKNFAEAALKEAKEHAETANRSKSEFLANMSHELRTPLNAIIGFSETLDHGVFGPLANEKQHEYVTDIHESGTHLLDLINEVLDVSAIEAGKLALDETDVDVTSVTDAAIRLVKSRAEQGGVELQVQLNGLRPIVRGDERRLKQIFVNLLSNAIKFTGKGGSVSLELCRNDDNSIAFLFADTGIGMSDEDLKKALEKFGQVKREKGIKNEGTGLGLPLAKSLVEAHGGKFNLNSIVGEGTTVTVSIPSERVVY